MADKVVHFSPSAQALENGPHMLRYWADMIERDEAAGIKAEMVTLVLVQRGNPAPSFFIAGTPHSAPHHPLFVAGVFDYCRRQMLAVLDQQGGPNNG